jgi:hypothetical protein
LDRAALERLLEFIEPLEALADEEGLAILLDRLAWDADSLGLGDPAVLELGVSSLITGLEGLIELLDQEEISLEDFGEALLPVAAGIAEIVAAIASRPRPQDVPSDAATRFAEDLLGFLVEHYLASRLPKALIVLRLLGLMAPIPRPALTAGSGQVVREQGTALRLDFDAIGAAFQDPLGYVRRRFVDDPNGGRRAAIAISDLVGPELADGLITAGLAASYGQVPDQPGLVLTPAERAAAEHLLIVDGSAAGPAGTRADLRVVVGLTDETPVNEGLGFLLALSGDVGIVVQRPGGTFSASVGGALDPLLITTKAVRPADGVGSPQLDFEVGYASPPAATEPFLRFGSQSSSRFELAAFSAEVSVLVDTAGVDVGGTVDTKGILLAIQGGDGDGFLDKVLPRDPIELKMDLGLDASVRKGVQVRGSGVLEHRFPIHKSLGPLEIQEIQLALALATTGGRLDLTGTVGLSIGPLKAVVEAMGVSAALRPASTPPGASGPSGNAGPVNLAIGFKPPSGAGFSIKAGPVTGGGYVFFDPDNEQYAGILQLGFQQIGLTAIGLLTTKLPDPAGPPGATKKGFSLVLIITIDLPPIQLGYGFTLNGVGGLLGIHRTMVVDALRNGVRDGSVNSILFPQDPIARAPQIISQLKAIFPPAEGRFIFGPMVKIGWGPNAILELSAAVVLELASPIKLVILGRIQAAIPDKKDTILNLRLDIVGVVDFDKSEVSVDASIIDSRLVVFTLTGDMALRVGWGATKMFALAAGGFHPRFQPPPGFPSLRRLGIALGDSDNPRLRMETYMALTANTIQFGAALDAYAEMNVGVGTFSASANASFDALIQFQPFELQAELGAAIDILLNGNPLLHAAFHATLTGPTPWHAVGYAEFDFLGKRRIDLELTSGPAAKPPISTISPGDVLKQVADAFASADAWAALPPREVDRVVSLREQQPTEGVVVHPLGSLSARQRVLPLGQTVDRFGTSEVAPTTFKLNGFQVGTVTITTPQAEDLHDDFPPGQFKALTDDQRLARPAFESMASGGRAQAKLFLLPTTRPGGTPGGKDFEESVVDVEPTTGARSPGDPPQLKTAAIPAATLSALTLGGPAAHAETRSNGSTEFRGPELGVTVASERYVVAGADTLGRVQGAPLESSAEAHDRLSRRSATAPPAQVVLAQEAS